MKAQDTNWDDLKLFLAVARAGSLSGAARRLGVNHSTVYRRIAGFEDGLGARLFDRLPNGYALTSAGEEVLAAAERVEADIVALDRAITGRDRAVAGRVRIAATDFLARWLLPRPLTEFRTEYPGIEVELLIGNEALDLSRRETDVALRISNAPPETLVGRRIGALRFAVYGAQDYLAARDEAPLDAQDWIGFDAAHRPLVQQFERLVPGVVPGIRSDSVACVVDLARAGAGLAFLPCAVAEHDHLLRQVTELAEPFALDLWLLTHEDLRHTARIRALMDFVADRLGRAVGA